MAAAGNSGYNTDKYSVYPAAFNYLDNVIAVTAIDRDGRLSRFANYGENSVDVAAPGSGVLTTWLDNSYQEGSGSS